MTRRILSHTADTGVEATADNLAALIVEWATAMFESMASYDSAVGDHEVEIEVSAPTPEDLVVEVLSELLYESEVEDLFLCDLTAEPVGPRGVAVKAKGVPLAQVEMTGPPVKAVTYHDLEVVESADGLTAKVYFDV